MPRYEFVGGNGRFYFNPQLGYVEPGDQRDMVIPPDPFWRRVPPPSADEAPAPALAGTSATPAADSQPQEA